MEFVIGAVAAGLQPRPTGSGSVVISQGRRYATLVTPDGTKTAAGRMYEQRSGNELPSGGAFSRDQQPQREGLTESIHMRDGSQRITRRFAAAGGEYTFTAVGRSFLFEAEESVRCSHSSHP